MRRLKLGSLHGWHSSDLSFFILILINPAGSYQPLTHKSKEQSKMRRKISWPTLRTKLFWPRQEKIFSN